MQVDPKVCHILLTFETNHELTHVVRDLESQRVEFFVEALKEGQNHGFDPSLRKLFMRACYLIMFCVVKVG